MAGGEDDRKSTWSSWLAPGDTRHTKGSAQHLDVTDHAKRATKCPKQSEPVPTSNGDADTYETNPFIAFKHFVDGKFAALTDFSSNVAELKRNAQEEEAVYQAATRDHYKRWTGNNGIWHSIFRYPEALEPHDQAKAAASLLIEESRRRNCYIPTLRIMELYSEDKDFEHLDEHHSTAVLGTAHAPEYCFVQSLESNHQILPSASELLFWRKCNGRFDSTRWLSVDWFKHSPYSPVNLEGDSDLSKYDTKWRNSFEDLLEASLGKPMTSEERSGHRLPGVPFTSTWRGPGIDWMLSLQCRGILPPQLPSLYSCVAIKESPTLSLSDYLSAPQIKSVENVPTRDPECRWQNAGYHTQSQLAHAEYMQLVHEIATPVPRDGVLTVSELLASEEQQLLPCPQGNTALRNYQNQLMRWEQAFERQRMQDAPMDSKCPDELGRAVGDVIQSNRAALAGSELTEAQMAQMLEAHDEFLRERSASITDWDWDGITPKERQRWREGRTSSEHQRQGGPITELDVYEYMDKHGDSYSESDCVGPACGKQYNNFSVGKCPDGLGRAVGEAARQQAARAFADEENGLSDDEELDDFDFDGFPDTRDEETSSEQANRETLAAYQKELEHLKDPNEISVNELALVRLSLLNRFRLLLGEHQRVQDENSHLHNILLAVQRDRDEDEQDSASEHSHSLQRAMHEATQYFTADEVAEHWEKIPQAMDNADVPAAYRDTVRALQKLGEIIGELDARASDDNVLLLRVADENMQRLLDENEFMRATQGAVLQELKALRDDREEAKQAAKTHGSRQLSDRPFNDSLSAQPHADKPGVLSTLTTTQTTRMPDGSVKTSVVLKRRFADGREETQESTQTSFDDSVAPGVGGDREGQKEKKKGWFWN